MLKWCECYTVILFSIDLQREINLSTPDCNWATAEFGTALPEEKNISIRDKNETIEMETVNRI